MIYSVTVIWPLTVKLQERTNSPQRGLTSEWSVEKEKPPQKKCKNVKM